ncbi:hypothetical protein SRB5_70530 [Streptomyces sp. RB5]|uniref:Uncharacterized protein n=1 Tax=Streptomyces smaragdinus TaxID=2585196 RepID=A0A7K0CTR7_9ACTN|nr:hypothetical protein [Streptomyces smaragdinus]
MQDAQGRGVGERDFSGEEFVEDDAERVEVGVRAHRAAHRLLRGHVRGAADGDAGAGEAGGVDVEDGGDAEVQDGEVALGADHDVAGLEVAVDDRDGVHGGEDRAELGGHGGGPVAGVRLVLGEVVGEVGALNVLHDEVQLVAVGPRVVHGDQPRMPDAGGDPAFAQEAAAQVAGLGAVGRARVEQLDGDAAFEGVVVALPDLAHAALADERGELVTARDDPSVHRRPSWSRRRRSLSSSSSACTAAIRGWGAGAAFGVRWRRMSTVR